MKVDIFNSDKTEMAVASKDSSNVNLNITEIKNTKLCFAAYRKKQEFAGGKIVISSSNCNKDNIYYSKGSQIVFKMSFREELNNTEQVEIKLSIKMDKK